MALLSSLWLIDALMFLSAIAVAVYAYFSRNYNYWRKLGVRQVPPSFFFGSAVACMMAKKTPDGFLNDMYKNADGEKMVGFYMFDAPYLLLRDPELIRNVFVTDFNNFSNRLLGGDDRDLLGRANLFLAKNPPWKHIRHKLTPVFTSGKLKKMLHLMMEISQDFENYLDGLKIGEREGKDVEIKEICAKFTTDIIGITAFGVKFNSLTDPEAEFRKYGKRVFRSTYKRYLHMLAITFLPPLRPFTNPKFFDELGTKFLRETFWHVINERVKTGAKRDDMIDLLIEMKEKQETDDTDEYKLEGDALVAQAAIFFVGGFETSSTTMTFALYEISKNPEIQRRLRDEILEGLKNAGGRITYDMITTLPYLNMVVHESLRMYPVLPWLDRLPETDYTFPGTNVTIKKGIPIILPMRSLHNDPKYFPNPTRFDPERFSEKNKKNIVPFTYFPFGEGPRNCIGGRLGLIQTKLGLIHFLSKYEVSPCKQTPIPMIIDPYNVLTQSAGGLYLNFKKLRVA